MGVVIEKITVINFGINDGGGNGRSCFGIEVGADASKPVSYTHLTLPTNREV